jgi:predicted MPP superfamily phosphohydrolase
MCFIALLGLLSMANPRTERIFDLVFWLVLGLAGLVIALLWFATEHTATKTNLNLFWALPTHLLFFWRRNKSEFVENYFTGTAILAALMLIFWAWIPQALPVAAIPLVVLVVVKGIWWRRRGTAWRERVPQRYAKV